MKRICTISLLALLFTSCGAEPRVEPSPASEAADDVLEVVCNEDGSTTIEQRDVAAQSDGVHFRVENRAGEFVSLNGTGMDFSNGVSEHATRVEPGVVKIACWPGSMHTEPEPTRTKITVHDPNGFWVPAELECPRDDLIGSSTLDYASRSSGEQGNPEEIARGQLKGLEPDDQIFTAGYPEAEYRDIAVERDGDIVAVLGYSPTEDGGWILGGYSVCSSSGINY